MALQQSADEISITPSIIPEDFLMSVALELPQSGTVTTHVLANLRQGAPRLTAPVIRKIPAGAPIATTAVAIGDAVQGNSKWYKTADDGYLWSGACSALTTAPDATDTLTASISGSAHGTTDYAGKLGAIPMVVDISHGDGVTNFRDAKAAGVVGIIHKATTGATGRTEFYAERRQQAREAGLLWGAYHWGTSADVRAQVENYLTYAAPDDETLMALDFEKTVGNQMTLQDCINFCQQILTQKKRKVVIYSGSTMKENLARRKDDFLGGHRLWLAQYGPKPACQDSWDSFWLWQYTDGIDNTGAGICTRVPGLTGDYRGHLDCNYYAGDADQLRSEWVS
jgi:hypothetical protein